MRMLKKLASVAGLIVIAFAAGFVGAKLAISDAGSSADSEASTDIERLRSDIAIITNRLNGNYYGSVPSGSIENRLTSLASEIERQH